MLKKARKTLELWGAIASEEESKKESKRESKSERKLEKKLAR